WAVSHGKLTGRQSHAEKTEEQQRENRCSHAAFAQPQCGGSGHGATEIYIAVPADRDPQPVRHVSTFTEDLHAAAAWLKACPIETVAMESTGVYWIPFFQILEARGFQVLLVKHTSCEECARTQVRCFRLSMAAVSSLGGF